MKRKNAIRLKVFNNFYKLSGFNFASFIFSTKIVIFHF